VVTSKHVCLIEIVSLRFYKVSEKFPFSNVI